ncbi:hypothetical protein HMPREF9713_00732 [Myroides odoratimimus CCUG 12700]|uniref:glycoside hydrolase domain-containing protein n=1 Tax=Myroides odoratimimus TaxID=76832 RepID=UPI000353AD45|nr:glycoside hydrolase domain-containing protein [Myroides odoratimimus]EPH13403.1 hypothetical protein HMPREF9713_00732 [Myroides odoratimimus CCUG 12700]
MKVEFKKFVWYALIIISLYSPVIKAQVNIAKGKKYFLSEVPNYILTNGSDEFDLTDGVKKEGKRFWNDKTTVGWARKNQVIIDLDLEEEFVINGFSINSARSEGAEVRFPLHCFVFTSNNKKEFIYQGDLLQDDNNTIGKYKVHSFALDVKSIKGRYVKFVLIANGKYIFLDEIEVFKNSIESENVSLYLKNEVILEEDIKSFLKDESKRILNIQYQKRLNVSDNEYLESSTSKSLIFNNMILLDSVHKNVLSAEIFFTPIEDYNELSNFTLNDIFNYHKEERRNEIKIDSELTYFSIVNNKYNSELITFNEFGNLEYDIYEVLPVKAVNKVNVKDALKLIPQKVLNIKPGEVRQFVISVLGTKKAIKHDISITNGDTSIGTLKFSIPEKYSNSIDLNVNLWAYLDKPILKDNIKTVVNDLEDGKMNVIVVHSGFIDGYTTKGFVKLKNYLKNFGNLQEKKIMLFYNFKNHPERKFGGKIILDKVWKENFKEWYTFLQEELETIGIDSKHIYFYPYDEINLNHISDYKDLVKWGKASISNFQTFVTINDKKSLEASYYADITQIMRSQLTSLKDIDNNNVWLYFAENQSRELNAYKDYRLLGWYAYFYDIKGVGFWNYCALSSIEDARYDDFVSGINEYSVIYMNSLGEILPSLRWLCFKQGLSDYSKLKMVEKQIGKEETLKFVSKVINNPNDTKQADNILRILFNQIN